MRDDEMDDVLRTAMSEPPPQVSPTFMQDVERRTAPRRLTPVGRVVMGVYGVAAVACCVWMLRDLPFGVTAATLAIQAGTAVALRSYTSRLTRSRA